MLKLPEAAVKSDIPQSYFSLEEPDFTSATQRRNLYETLTSFPESPLTPGQQYNFTPAFPPASGMNHFNNNNNNSNHNNNNNSRLLAPNLSEFLHMQNAQLQAQLSPIALSRSLSHQMSQLNLNLPSISISNMMSPRSSDANTSGYGSNTSMCGSNTSMDQTYAPYNRHMQLDQDNGVSRFSQLENQMFASNSNNNFAYRLNEAINNHSFNIDNHALTPTYNNVAVISFSNSFYFAIKYKLPFSVYHYC